MKKILLRVGVSLLTIFALLVISYFLVINLVEIKASPGNSLAITRAEGINMATASFIQAEGRQEAVSRWNDALSEQDRYLLIRDFLSFAPLTLAEFQPDGYTIKLSEKLEPLKKAVLIYKNKEFDY